MNEIFKKLNYKDQKQIHVIGAPDSFDKAIDEMKGITTIKTTLPAAGDVAFFIGFVKTQEDVDTLTNQVLTLIQDDGVLWFAYPKGSSKKYKCDFNRDTGWSKLGDNGFEPVRMVAIDEDWSALRLRKATHIKKMTRSRAISETGKKRISIAGKNKK